MTPRSIFYTLNRLKSLRPEELRAKIKLVSRHALDRGLLPFTKRKSWSERAAAGLSKATSSPKTDATPEAYDKALREAIPRAWWDDKSFWAQFGALYPSDTEFILDRARSAVRGSFTLFQWKTVETGERINWSSTLASDDPSEEWPQEYHSKMRVLYDPTRPMRDIKWCWELNRFQSLILLGAAWRLTGEELFARTAREHIESWLEDNVYPYGAQWNSNLEVALRSLSWARCHILCRDSPAWDADFMRLFLKALHVHATHLYRELTAHHPQSNHLLGEACALTLMGRFYPLFAGADKWRKKGAQAIAAAVSRLILPDGVYAEQSTGYLRFVAEFLLEVIHCAQARNEELISDEVKEAILRSLRFIAVAPHDLADVPMIGDSDTGLAMGWQISDFWDFRWIVAAGAALLDSPELAAEVETLPAEAYLLLGPDGAAKFDSLRERATGRFSGAKRPDVCGFPTGGYIVSRDDLFHIVFDCGPLGLEPTCAHGHCDALAFNLAYKGRPLFVDPGTYAYNGAPAWRNYFRSSLAHNTLRLDRSDPSTPMGPFKWIHPYSISTGPCFVGERWRIFSARVDLRSGPHTRYILHLPNRLVLIADYLQGIGRHDVESSLHLAPEWRVQQKDGALSLLSEDHAVELFHKCGEEAAPEILEGQENPEGGWYSRHYWEKVPSPTLRWSYRTELPAVAIFCMKPAGLVLDEALALPGPGLPDEAVSIMRSHPFGSFLKN